jgi:NitT/TauT family transport system ATP-binding protein
MTNPFLLLMDEPFAALDAMTREELQIDLLKLCWERGTTVLFITHDISEAVYLSDKIAVMGEGFIQDQITIDISKPRENKLRYETSFNTMCSKIYNSMKNSTFQNQVDP